MAPVKDPTRRGRQPAGGLGLLSTAAVLCALALPSCGTQRQLMPDVTTPGPPLGTSAVRCPRAGLVVAAPAGWDVARGESASSASDGPPSGSHPVIVWFTGEATIAVFRYRRRERLPDRRSELNEALDRLTSAARARDATLDVLSRRVLSLDGKPAVQIRAREEILGHPRTVRSTHVYAYGAEIVIEGFAPNDQFARVDAQIFRPFLRSVRFAPAKRVRAPC